MDSFFIIPGFYFFVSIGLIQFVSVLVQLVIFVRRYFFRKRLDLLQRYGHGTWAVVTGATAGIGLEFCH